jgi:hypothetical protein
MDKKIKAGAYGSLDDYLDDFELMCNNALQYNEDASIVNKVRGCDELRSSVAL